MRRICAFSGKRGGFGAYLPLMRRALADPELELLVLLGDQHGSPQFGNTADEVRAQLPGAEIELIEMGTGRGDTPLVRVENLAACLHGAAEVLERWAPEVVLVHGDRGEHLMVAFAAANLGSPSRTPRAATAPATSTSSSGTRSRSSRTCTSPSRRPRPSGCAAWARRSGASTPSARPTSTGSRPASSSRRTRRGRGSGSTRARRSSSCWCTRRRSCPATTTSGSRATSSPRCARRSCRRS